MGMVSNITLVSSVTMCLPASPQAGESTLAWWPHWWLWPGPGPSVALLLLKWLVACVLQSAVVKIKRNQLDFVFFVVVSATCYVFTSVSDRTLRHYLF